MSLKHITLALLAFVVGCTSPKTIGPKNTLWVVAKPTTEKGTILVSEVLALIKEGKLGAYWSENHGPYILSFKNGILVGLRPSLAPAIRKEIFKPVDTAPNMVISGIE